MAELARGSPERLNLMMRGHSGPDPVLLLGAGASVKSGVPLAADLVSMAAIWGYCQHHGRTVDDPSITRSDWWPWLSAQGWFHPEALLADQYPQAVERLLRPRESRREFFLHVLSRAQAPSIGYEGLARLVAANTVRHVLTVNFDDLARRACLADPQVSHVEVIEGPADLVKFSLAASPYPQIVYLHGAVARYEDRNLVQETQELDPAMRDAVLPLLRDHPLVVLGYRGTEPSIMQDLLLRGADQINAYRHGVFWCIRPDEQLSQPVVTLADRLDSNFSLVEIVGFDEAMDGWANGVRPAPAPAPKISVGETEPDVPDLRPNRALTLGDLDRGVLTSRLAAYAERMDLPQLDSVDDEALLARLRELRLARIEGSTVLLTRAAGLLFGTNDRTRIEIHTEDVFLPVSGNVFRVLDQTLEALDDLNQPFRVKAQISEDVRRFHPRAIKEIVVNALAHRDHDRPEPVRITLSPRTLTVDSPGGLVPGLSVGMLGERGARGYRNPVLADLLYGCGSMDKRGSGVADIRRWTRRAGGDATFAVASETVEFRVLLTSRELDPNPITGTADPGDLEHFVTNVLPISVGDSLFLSPSTVASRSEVYDAHPDEPIAPFAFSSLGLFTLDAPENDSVLAAHVSGPSETYRLSDLTATVDGTRLFAQLLNSAVFSWADEHGLFSDMRGRRLWFPRSEDGAAEITYRARVREATRTVTKPNVSRTTEKVRYWEHEALRFSFRRFGRDWGMQLVPTVVFTKDGYADLLRGPKVGPLATRRMARDFNPQVQNDLYFWRWVLARGEPVSHLHEAIQVEANFIAGVMIDAPPATAGLHSDDDPDFVDDIADEVAELASDRAAGSELDESR